MPGKYAHAVKHAFRGCVWLRQVESHLIRSELLNLNGLARNLKEVSLRRVDLLIKIDLEAEQDVISVEGVAVRKRDPASQFHRVAFPVRRNLPGFRQRCFGALRVEVYMDQV